MWIKDSVFIEICTHKLTHFVVDYTVNCLDEETVEWMPLH